MSHSTHEQPQTKKCTRCGESKPLSEFYRQRSNADGLRGECKTCKAEQERVWREANSERIAEYKRAWNEANKERRAEASRAWYEANRERVAEQGRARYEANRERIAETNRAWVKANREKVAEIQARRRAKHPDRVAARSAVSNAVRDGKLPPASTQVCIACGEPAQNWHHHLGYDQKHWLDVVSVCRTCHVKLDREDT